MKPLEWGMKTSKFDIKNTPNWVWKLKVCKITNTTKQVIIWLSPCLYKHIQISRPQELQHIKFSNQIPF